MNQVGLLLLIISSGLFGEGRDVDYIQLKNNTHAYTKFLHCPPFLDCKDAYGALKNRFFSCQLLST